MFGINGLTDNQLIVGSIMNGEQLVMFLMEHGIGVHRSTLDLFEIDEKFAAGGWIERGRKDSSSQVGCEAPSSLTDTSYPIVFLCTNLSSTLSTLTGGVFRPANDRNTPGDLFVKARPVP